METSVNNKCKAFTSLEQSKKLAEILPLESADMYWDLLSKDKYAKVNNIGHCLGRTCVYAWSLAALLGVLPKIHGLKPILDLEENSILYSGIDLYKVAGNPVDACYEMILKLNELKML